MSMLEAARMGDKVAHSNAMFGFIAGMVVGAVMGFVIAGGLALLAGATVLTGGLALLVIGGAVLAGAGGGALKGMSLGARSKKGSGDPIKTGARRTFIGGDKKPAARAVIDEVTCHAGKHIAQGSKTVIIEKYNAARRTDQTECGGKIDEGWPTVFIGKEAATFLPIEGEVPGWMVKAAQIALVVGTAMSIVGGVIVAGVAVTVGGVIGGMVGGKAGGMIGGWVGEQLGGADGRAWGEAIGEEIGGFLGGAAGSKIGARGQALEIAATRGVLSKASPELNARLAKAPGEHPTQIAARQNVSRRYMETADPYNPANGSRAAYDREINSKMAGTDFRHPVEVVPLKAGQKLYTYKEPGATTPGGFLTYTKQSPESIGIAANKGGVPKELYEVTLKQDTQALVSTASRKYDSFTNTAKNKDYSLITDKDGNVANVADSTGGAIQVNIIADKKATFVSDSSGNMLKSTGETSANHVQSSVNQNLTVPLEKLTYNRPVVAGDAAFKPTAPPNIGSSIGSGTGDLGGSAPGLPDGDPNDGDP